MASASERHPSLDGRWALVTGAAKRIGAVIARTLHSAGADVAIHYNRSARDADKLANELNGVRPGSAVPPSARTSNEPVRHERPASPRRS